MSGDLDWRHQCECERAGGSGTPGGLSASAPCILAAKHHFSLKGSGILGEMKHSRFWAEEIQ